jgi:amino acid permease
MSVPENNFWNGYALVLNSIIGPSVLAIPWAFSKGGIILGILCQFFTTLISTMLTYQLLQIISRLELIKDLQESGYLIKPVSLLELFKTTSPSSFIIKGDSSEDFNENSSMVSNSKLKITRDCTDLTEMVQILLGPWNAYVFCFLFTLSIFGTLMAYGSIFASSLASTVPIFGWSVCNVYEDTENFGDDCWRKYWVYMFVFISFAGLLSLISLKQQAGFQGILAFCRIFIMSLMVLTALEVLVLDNNLDDNNDNDADFKLFQFEKISVTFPILLLANLFHPNIPNAIFWVKNKNKLLNRIIFWSIFTVSVFYLLIGVIVSISVDDVQQQATLNWIDYTGGKHDQKWWSYTIMYIILLFPVLDIASSFPIYSIGISDNLMTIFGADKSDLSIKNNTFIVSRLLVVFLSIIAASFYYNLGQISQFTGTLIVLSLGIYIPLMSQASKKIIVQEGFYDKYFGSTWMIWISLLVNIIFSVLCWVFLMLNFT